MLVWCPKYSETKANSQSFLYSMAPHPAGPGLALLQPSKYNTYLSFVAVDVVKGDAKDVTAVFCGEKKEFIIKKQDKHNLQKQTNRIVFRLYK